MKYLLNINARTVHFASSKDGRCKIENIREENKIMFNNLKDAVNYLPQGKKPTKLCSFCFPNKE